MRCLVALTISACAVLVAPAHGSGLPVTGTDAGRAGVTAPGVGTRYVTVRARDRTLIMGIARHGGQIVARRTTRERLVVPAVTYDLTATGLSADGRTLVLARPRTRFPQRRSAFRLFDAGTLRPRGRVVLRGDFTLDAISPDGNRLYLIQSQRFPRYAVRAYDVAARRLEPDAVVDPAEADEPMLGVPMARVMSLDGRWAYTLYDADEPFIHALDTEHGRAKCIDLPGLASGAVDRLRLRPDGTLAVGPGPVRLVDTRTFAVREPQGVASPSPRSVADDGPGWLEICAGLALLALLGAGAAKAGGARIARPRLR